VTSLLGSLLYTDDILKADIQSVEQNIEEEELLDAALFGSRRNLKWRQVSFFTITVSME
jgi:hypothetical protein